MSLIVVVMVSGARSPDGYGGCGNHHWMEPFRAKTAATVDAKKVVIASVGECGYYKWL